MLSLSGHKIHAPKGIGALYLRKGTKFAPFMIGGHQEKAIELRSPTDASLRGTFSVIPTSVARQILGLRWSPDGARLAYSTNEGRAVVLDAATGDTIFSAQIYTGDNWKVREIHGFDLSRNGKLLALSNNNGRIEIWDVDTGKRVCVLHDPEQYSDLDCIAFSSTSDQLAAALRFGRRTTWNIETGEAFEHTPQSNKNGYVAWNRSGTRFAATGGDSFAVFELNHAEPQKTLSHRTIARVSWIGDDRLVSAGYDHVIRIWDAKSYALLSELQLHRSPVTELTASFDEKFLAASAGDEVKVAVLDSNSRQAARLIPKVTREGERQLLVWENQGRLVASGHLEIHGRNDFLTPLRIWDINTEQLVGQQTIGVIRELAWRPDQQAVWATTHDGRFHEFNFNKGTLDTLRKYWNHAGGGRSSFSPDGRWLALGDQVVVKLVDTKSLEVIRSLDIPGGAWSMQWSNDSGRVAIGEWNNLIIWDPFANSAVRRQTNDTDERISSLTWSPADSAVVLGRRDGLIQVVAADTLADITYLRGHSGEVYSVAWAGNGRRIASAGGDGTIRIWDAATGHELLSFHHPDERPFFATAWSPDSRRLAGGDNQGEVFIWGSERIKLLPSIAKELATGVLASHATGK
jgi:WD40 repeat protein